MKNIIRTLYVSDLDGTLFNKQKKVSNFTIDILNKFIDKGGLFTIATGRTWYGCDYKLEKIKINVPAILMNGAFLYSFSNKKYIDIKKINFNKIKQIEKILNEYNNFGFMYTYDNNKISIFYKNTNDLKYAHYYSERAIAECKEITKVDNFTDTAKNKDVIYFALSGEEKLIRKIWENLQNIPLLGSAIYLNIYDGLYCLEIFDYNAGKAIALQKLKIIIRAHKVIVFGDNYNDIDMMNNADESYVPENAIDKAKEIADGVIESCDDDGVAKFIKRKYRI